MRLTILNYGHPALRQRGAPVTDFTPEIKQFIADLLQTMYANKGIGLAAQQVGRALRVTVIDVREVTDRPSTLELDGAPADVAAFMPLVLVNPVITPIGPPVAGMEGCLSFPEIFADIVRPELVEVVALDGQGKRIQFRCGGLLARAAQHETDHLHGILFIDRMSREVKDELRPQLEKLQAETKAALKKK